VSAIYASHLFEHVEPETANDHFEGEPSDETLSDFPRGPRQEQHQKKRMVWHPLMCCVFKVDVVERPKNLGPYAQRGGYDSADGYS